MRLIKERSNPFQRKLWTLWQTIRTSNTSHPTVASRRHWIMRIQQSEPRLRFRTAGTGQASAWLSSTAESISTRICWTRPPVLRIRHGLCTALKVSFRKGTALATHGHGTHVAGILAGNATSSTGTSYYKSFRGMAPNVKLIDLRVLDANGSGTDSNVILAIDRAIQLKCTYAVRVINLSLGRPVVRSYSLDPLCQAVERAWRAGIMVVVAAGNEGRNQSAGTDGYATITSPGDDPLVITVGGIKTVGTASRADDQIASYSSKGPTLIDHVVKPDLVAPGNRTISLLASNSLLDTSSSTNKILLSAYQNTNSTRFSSDYYRLSGTSMATPIVSGAAAIMLSRDPMLTPDTIKARLMKTATKSFPSYSTAIDPVTNTSFTSQYDIFTIGAGYVDIWAAVNSSVTVPAESSAASPLAVIDPSTNTVQVINSTVAIWGSAAEWAPAAVWGNSVFVDGANTIWGTSGVSGCRCGMGHRRHTRVRRGLGY